MGIDLAAERMAKVMNPTQEKMHLPPGVSLVGVDRPDRAPEARAALRFADGRVLAAVAPPRPDQLSN
jgi:hypothetical protein